MSDAELARRLAEAIAKVLSDEHYPGCECSAQLKNLCNRRRLIQAIKEYHADKYHAEHPEFDDSVEQIEALLRKECFSVTRQDPDL